MTNFEEKLKRLEELSASIKKSDISLEDALKDFEEGIKLAKSMEKSLDEMESKIQILMNNPEVSEEDEDILPCFLESLNNDNYVSELNLEDEKVKYKLIGNGPIIGS